MTLSSSLTQLRALLVLTTQKHLLQVRYSLVVLMPTHFSAPSVSLVLHETLKAAVRSQLLLQRLLILVHEWMKLSLKNLRVLATWNSNLIANLQTSASSQLSMLWHQARAATTCSYLPLHPTACGFSATISHSLIPLKPCKKLLSRWTIRLIMRRCS